MDYIELKKKWKKDSDYPDRTFEMQMYRRVLEGDMYDVIKNPFFKTLNTSQREHIPLSERRPSVRYRIPKVVVDNSVSLLFGEGRFPMVDCDDENSQLLIKKIIDDRKINYLMIDAATKGSTGSCAIFIRVIDGRLFFEASYTEYLTPIFKPLNPDELESVVEKCKKTGQQLIDLGYVGLNKKEIYWFVRVWDEMAESYYKPWLITEKEGYVPELDRERTVIHGLGTVPVIWIINLPGKCSKIDGACTFKDAIDTNIELDYQMSQCGRGLKYSSEPLLMIRGAGMEMEGNSLIGEGNVISVDQGGDAKHVEISGDACKAVLEFSKVLREIAIENIHGNRSTPEKGHHAQSGKAMELMNMTLVWLSDKLRISYGECALVSLIKIICEINKKTDIILSSERLPKGSLNCNNISLKWPGWFPSTEMDRRNEAETLVKLKDGGLMSQEQCLLTLSSEYDITDIEEEMSKISKDKVELLKLEPKTQVRINA